MKQKIKHGILDWSLEHVAASLKLSPEEVRQYFTDGRRVSFVLERRLAREIIKGSLAESEGAGFDLVDPEGGKWEVRSISKGGIYFCPSYMVGSGRKFQAEGFLQKLSEVKGYIISDIEMFPSIPFWIVPVEVVRAWWDKKILGKNSHLSRSLALQLVEATE